MTCSKVNKIMVQGKEGKRKRQREEVVKRTNAEAQEQENVFPKEEKIINASVEEDLQEDIVKEYPRVAGRKPEAIWKKMVVGQENYSLKNYVREVVMMGLVVSQRRPRRKR